MGGVTELLAVPEAVLLADFVAVWLEVLGGVLETVGRAVIVELIVCDGVAPLESDAEDELVELSDAEAEEEKLVEGVAVLEGCTGHVTPSVTVRCTTLMEQPARFVAQLAAFDGKVMTPLASPTTIVEGKLSGEPSTHTSAGPSTQTSPA